MSAAKSKDNSSEMEDTQNDVETSPNSGIKVPEAFQLKVDELLKGASKQEIDYVQDCCSDLMSEIYEKEHKDEFSTADMPKNY